MIYLLLAIAASALISTLIRISNDKVKNNIAMLVMNYAMCLVLSVYFTGIGRMFPAEPELPATALMGVVHGMLYLGSFLLLQGSIRKNGIVLSSIFMKLGLLVPMTVSIFLFREIPSAVQAVGFAIAVAAIILINYEGSGTAFRFNWGLLLLLLGGGSGDAMSKIYEQLGSSALAPQFLLYTFITALTLGIVLMFVKHQHVGKYEALFGLAIGVPNFFCAKFLLKALDFLPAVIVYPTFSVGTILVVTLTGVLLFREKLKKQQWLALGIILLALALLNL